MVWLLWLWDVEEKKNQEPGGLGVTTCLGCIRPWLDSMPNMHRHTTIKEGMLNSLVTNNQKDPIVQKKKVLSPNQLKEVECWRKDLAF